MFHHRCSAILVIEIMPNYKPIVLLYVCDDLYGKATIVFIGEKSGREIKRDMQHLCYYIVIILNWE